MTSRLSQMQARFQQKQMQEKEEKLLKLYENQQQRAFERVGRGSAGSNGSVTNITTGKVRQMFDERRQKAGIDRSYPLEPLKNNRNTGTTAPRAASLDRKIPPTTRTTVKNTVAKTTRIVHNGKPIINKREVVQSLYNNNRADDSYEEKRYVDDEADDYLKQHKDIVEMMNNHNLGRSLDEEEMPRIGFDEYDDSIFTGKLPNVGKLPSQTVKKANASPKTIKKPAVISPKKEVKPVVKPSTPERILKRPSTAVSNSSSSTPSSPTGSKMLYKQGGDRTPNANRPSAKNTPRVSNSMIQRDDLASCRYCQRRFATERLQTHEDICSRTGKKKRKLYDATKHRLAGTEIEPYTRKGGAKTIKNSTVPEATKSSNKQTKPASSKNNWRQKHEEFISAIRAAKQAQAHLARGGSLKDLPPPPPSTNPDYIQCPHCSRRFNESAAERHIPKCATFQFNKPKPSGARLSNKSLR